MGGVINIRIKGRKAIKTLFICAAVLCFAAPQSMAQESVSRSVEGSIADWFDVKPLAEDSEGDCSQEDFDFLRFYAAKSQNYLVVRLDVKGKAALNEHYNLFMDTDGNNGTGFTSNSPMGKIEGMDYMLQGAKLFKFNGVSQDAWSWASCGDVVNACSGHALEFAIPLKIIKSDADKKVNIVSRFSSADWRYIRDSMPDSGSVSVDINSLSAAPIKVPLN